jgi:hypothetical protein
MKTILICLALSFAALPPLSARADTAISRADIIKTVEHLQQRCNEAEAAQASALAKSADLQKSIDVLAAQRDAFKRDAAAMETARDFWRGCVWKLGLLSLGLSLWIFRKPILALCGI